MANLQQAKKYIRVSERRRVFNDRRRRAMREAIKNLKTLIEDKKFKEAKTELSSVYKAIDKATKRGVIKKNTASRKKSRLSGLIKRESVEA
ncbi:MAG: 30S ribosomal protein S20 [Candidatus Nomurabacteria bacterium]|nr:30S ribosomal protein S20 [Candidatus Nomurabacteria bacterium]